PLKVVPCDREFHGPLTLRSRRYGHPSQSTMIRNIYLSRNSRGCGSVEIVAPRPPGPSRTAACTPAMPVDRAWGARRQFDASHSAAAMVENAAAFHGDSTPDFHLSGEFRAQRFHPLAECRVFGHLPLDLLDRMDHRRVIPSAEDLADVDEREVEKLADQVHGHLARDRQLLRATLGREVRRGDAPVLRHPVPDHRRVQFLATARRADAAAEGLTG